MDLTTFKVQHGIQGKIPVRKGKGRMFADLIAKNGQMIRLYFSEACDLTKSLYVNVGKYDELWVGNNTGASVVGEV